MIEFVANMWKHMGLLEDEPDGPAPQEIRPNHLSSSKMGMPLRGYAILGQVQFLRTVVEGKKHNVGTREINPNQWGFAGKPKYQVDA